MPRATCNGIEIEYETIGDGEPMLLVMGIGAQLVYWPDRFCQQLAARGYRIIRFDNRDVGLSTKLVDAPVPNVPRVIFRGLLGLDIDAPYTLRDMANDSAALLEALGIERAHVVGVSMGGMIAQSIAIAHPNRVASLTSIMSHPGGRRYLVAAPRAIRSLLAPAPRNRVEAMDRAEAFFRAVGSPGFRHDVDAIRDRAAISYDRCFYPRGFVRQLAAIVASPPRIEALGTVHAPTLVIHGSHDPLIRPAGGVATARAIPGATLRIVEGMGHDMPEGAWPLLIDAIVANARRAAAMKGARAA